MRLFASIFALLLAVAISAQHKETVYSWQSPSGTVSQTGGTIVQHNSLGVSRINFLSSGYYTIQLCGKKENMTATDNSLNSVYFTITLADGNTFKAGDDIEVTAMRNNDDGGNASIYFLYGNPSTGSGQVSYEDTNTWANLGRMHEVDFSGGTSAKMDVEDAMDTQDVGTEPVKVYSLDPSTNTFTVPEAADGSTTLSITRNESLCMLYITKIAITRNTPTAINEVKSSLSFFESLRFVKASKLERGKGRGEAFSLSGQRVNNNSKGLLISKDKKIIR